MLYSILIYGPEAEVAATERLNFKGGFFEISPLMWLDPGVVAPMVPEEELRGRAPWSPA